MMIDDIWFTIMMALLFVVILGIVLVESHKVDILGNAICKVQANSTFKALSDDNVVFCNLPQVEKPYDGIRIRIDGG